MSAPPPSDRSPSRTETYHRGREARWAAVAFTVGVIAATALMRWRPFRVEVRGASMRPALEAGDWALAVTARRVRRGDVVVLEHPGRPGFEIVKRVRALAGDRTPDGRLIAEGELWVEGDDREGSTDSRGFGPVAKELVRGKLVLVWWPPERRGLI